MIVVEQATGKDAVWTLRKTHRTTKWSIVVIIIICKAIDESDSDEGIIHTIATTEEVSCISVAIKDTATIGACTRDDNVVRGRQCNFGSEINNARAEIDLSACV